MKHVFIIGSKGIPAAYGGFETFVEQLTKRAVNKNIKYHVACMDTQNGEKEHNNAHCFHIKVPAIGAARAVYYDLAALKYTLNYIESNQIEEAVVYILACRIGPFIGHYAKKIHALGGKLYVNPDGHEWKRAKWSAPIRKYWKISEKGMIRHADLAICDSKTIEMYIRRDYKKYHPRTTYIAYGAQKDSRELIDNPIRAQIEYKEWLANFDLKEKEYYLVVGRMVPENNYETIVREFMASQSQKKLVFVTDHKDNKFYEAMKERTGLLEDERVCFVGTIYNQSLLYMVRQGAFAYIHGHEVGGTNPSLLEALASTNVNLLLDVGFNREVAEGSALYWKKEKGNLTELIHRTDLLDALACHGYGEMAKERIERCFSWDFIVEQYEDLFVPQIESRHCSARRPCVSVCMASYNGEKYIREQIDSILSQLRYDDELVISDDGSRDSTLDIICEYENKDRRVRLVKGPGEGVKQNVANAIRYSKLSEPDESGFLFLADQDDVWMPNKVERVLETFEKEDCDLVLHDALVVDATLEKVLMESFFDYRHSGPGALKNITKNTYMGASMAIRSSAIMDSLPIPDVLAMHDWWIGVRCDLHGKGNVFLKEKLIQYRRHQNTVSDFEHNSLAIMLRNRLVFLHYLRKY